MCLPPSPRLRRINKKSETLRKAVGFAFKKFVTGWLEHGLHGLDTDFHGFKGFCPVKIEICENPCLIRAIRVPP